MLSFGPSVHLVRVNPEVNGGKSGSKVTWVGHFTQISRPRKKINSLRIFLTRYIILYIKNHVPLYGGIVYWNAKINRHDRRETKWGKRFFWLI
jgi:hypothetical protein